MAIFGFTYWKILGVVRRQSKVATDRRKITAMAKEPVAGTSKGKIEPATNAGSSSDKSGRDKGVNKEATPVASTSQQAGEQKQGVSKAKLNVLRTMTYIFICFVICWLPMNIASLYIRITVKSTNSAWHMLWPCVCTSQVDVVIPSKRLNVWCGKKQGHAELK